MYFITIILVVSALFFAAHGSRFSLFTKERTYLLKALLPYMIFVHHSHLFDDDFQLVGPFVVAIFFFMSGYGLETKRTQGGRFYKFNVLVNALRKLLVPLVLPLIIFLTIRLTLDTFEVVYVENIRKYQLILPYTWFVVSLIVLYVFFYVAASISDRKKSRYRWYLCIIVLEIMLFNLVGRRVGVPGYAHVTTTAFIAGILYQRYENDLMRVYNKNIKRRTIITSIVIVLLTIYIQADVFDNKDRPLNAFFYPICFMLLYAVIPTCKNFTLFGRTVAYLSSISYELYICQSIAFLLLGEKSLYYPIVYILLLFILCTIVASVCKYMTDKMFYIRLCQR